MTPKTSLFDRVTVGRKEPDDLLDIPTFLRRGTKENEAAMARGAELLTARPCEQPSRKPPDPRDQDPTKAQEIELVKLGWSSNQIRKLSRLDAAFMLEKKFGPEVRFTRKTHTDDSPDPIIPKQAPVRVTKSLLERITQRRNPASSKRVNKVTSTIVVQPLRSDAVIQLLCRENPRKIGTRAHGVYALYRDGMTVAEFYAAGGKSGDLNWDLARGHVRLS